MKHEKHLADLEAKKRETGRDGAALSMKFAAKLKRSSATAAAQRAPGEKPGATEVRV